MLRRLAIMGVLGLSGILRAQEVPESDDVRVEAPIIAAIHAQQAKQAELKVHAFNDRENLALFSADLLVRTLDWQSTRMLLTNPCKCFHEAELPASIAGNSPKMLAYSLGVSAGVHGLAYVAHKTGHHKIERALPMIDILNDGRDVINNYAISGRRPK